MIHLRSVALSDFGSLPEDYPFSIPVVRGWQPLEFTAPITFFVGENGSGKSTVLEALAIASGRITVGSEGAGQDASLKSVRRLAGHFKLAWRVRTHKGFFLRAEDFFGFVKAQNRNRAEMESELAEVDREFVDRSDYARGLAIGPLAGQLAAQDSRYQGNLDHRSHGESFLALFQARFVPGGLYLLDEPEAPLSPLRQLTLLTLIREMVAHDAQFIIATHSPILMAFPDAHILSFDSVPPERIAYADLEHVNLTRDFLNAPERFLRHL
jgi:predicted ATPase